MLFSQISKAFFGLIALFPLSQQLLSIELSLGLVGVAVDGSAGGGIGLTALELDQHMTDILHSEIIGVFAAETNNIITVDDFALAAAGGVGDDGDVAFLAGLEGGFSILVFAHDFANQPITEVGGNTGIQSIFILGRSSVLVFAVDGQGLDCCVESVQISVITAGQFISSSLCSYDSSGLLLVGVGDVALVVLGTALAEAACVQQIVRVGVRIVCIGLLGLEVQQLVSVEVQRIGVGTQVGACQSGNFQIAAVALLAGAVAIDCAQITIQIAVTIVKSIQLISGDGAVQRLLLVFSQLVTILDSHIIQSVGALDGGGSGGQEVVGEGFAGLSIGDLLIQGLGDIHDQLDVVAVLVNIVVHGINEEVIGFNSRDAVIANNDGAGVLVKHILNGVAYNGAHKNAHDQSEDHPEGEGVGLHFLCFFCSGDLTLSHVLFFAQLLFLG